MKRHIIQQQCLLFLLILALAGCSKKNYPANSSSDAEQQVVNTVSSTDKYIPPPVIFVSDDLAKSTKDGELYYDNESGYRYWRKSDGKYYLDTKYESGATPKQRIIAKKLKKISKRQSQESRENAYANQ